MTVGQEISALTRKPGGPGLAPKSAESHAPVIVSRGADTEVLP